MGRYKQLLLSMTPEDAERFAGQMALVEKLLGIAKTLLAGIGVCVSGLIAVVIWVNNTTAAIASTKEDVIQMKQEVKTFSLDRNDAVKEWSAWRAKKDEADTQLLAMAANQQRTIDRIYLTLDKLDAKLSKE